MVATAAGCCILPLLFSTAIAQSGAVVTEQGILTATAADGRLLFLPLNPTVIKNSSNAPLINVFVKQGSFGQYSISIVPTIAWTLSSTQEQSLKKLGAKTYAPWPSAQATPYVYYATSDSDLKFLSSKPLAIVAGANSAVEFQIDSVEPNDVRDLLFGKRTWGVIFSYDVSTPVRVDREIKSDWVQSLLNDIRSYGKLPVSGAVSTIFEAVKKKYLNEFGVLPEQTLQVIVRIVRAAPQLLEGTKGQPELVHDLSAQTQISLTATAKGPVYLQDFYQGKLELGNICSSVPNTVFVTSDRGSSVGCNSLRDQR
jgi:hypothetical protein